MDTRVMAANAFILNRPYQPNQPAITGLPAHRYPEVHHPPHVIMTAQAT